MPVKIFNEGTARDFQNPIELPKDERQLLDWQELNRSWWQRNPMRYDIGEKITCEEFSKEFYEQIDSTFFQSVWQFLPWGKIPFDPLIDYHSLQHKDVLEIGIGCGSNAKLLTQYARSFVGIDITDYAVECTLKRLYCYGLKGNIVRMDAEKMEFEDNSFDFVWSWGVIHHSSNTRKILEEICRVLRPDGEAIIMIYHRSFWNTYVRGGLYYGILRGELLKGKSLNRIIQDNTDGALARYYTISEWRDLVSDLFYVKNISIYGSKSQIIPLPWGKIKQFLMSVLPNSLGRLIVNRPTMGFLLVSTLKKKQVWL